MDLKFRSDILGRSVLFMGYSFRDLNIRVVWFKLMRMMKDIHPADRPSSYILTFHSNPVLETLYDEVGITTIVLDPKKLASTEEERSALVAEFLYELVGQAAEDGKIPGQSVCQHLSSYDLRVIKDQLTSFEKSDPWEVVTGTRTLQRAVERAAARRIPRQLSPQLAEILTQIVRQSIDVIRRTIRITGLLATAYINQVGTHRSATTLISLALAVEAARRQLLTQKETFWIRLWEPRLDSEQIATIIEAAKHELHLHQRDRMDLDLAYLADVLMRIKQGDIVTVGDTESSDLAAELLEEIAVLYPAVLDITPSSKGPPQVDAVIEQIEAALNLKNRETHSEEYDDIPF